MKKHKLFPFLRWTMCNSLLATLLATALSLAGCTADDNETAGEMLPEGKYPLTFTATQADATDTASPHTRVSENTDGTSSQWDGGEQISVQIGDATETGTYTLDADGKIKTADKPLYWQSTAPQIVTAWYPVDGTTVSLADQSSGLAYVMKATASDVAYNTLVSLKFHHQLAKVRVMLAGEKADDVKTVQVYSYTSCTHTRGEVSGSAPDWITMKSVTYNETKCWEANVVPGYAIRVKVNDTECQLTTPVTPQKATLHAITIDVKQREPTVLEPGGDGNYTVNAGDYVLIKGTGSKTTGQITINGTATVTIQDVNIETNAKSSIYIKNGTATIKLEGNNILNSINSSGGAAGIELNGTGSHVIIEGNGNASLTVTADYGNPAIGSANGGKGGNITIQNANITAKAININTNGRGCGAAIGSGSSFNEGEAHIGIITIINSDIKASVGSSGKSSAAVIGTGDTTYSNEKNSCDGINITLKAGQTKTQFLSNLTGTYNVQVGAGSNSRGGTTTCGSINWYNSDGSPAN